MPQPGSAPVGGLTDISCITALAAHAACRQPCRKQGAEQRAQLSATLVSIRWSDGTSFVVQASVLTELAAPCCRACAYLPTAFDRACGVLTTGHHCSGDTSCLYWYRDAVILGTPA